MHNELKTVADTTSIAEAARNMRAEQVGALLIVQGEDIIGLVTQTDVVRKAIAHGVGLNRTSVRQIMSPPTNGIEVSRTLQDAHDMMADLGARHLIVREGGRIVGLVSVRDLVSFFQDVRAKNRSRLTCGDCGDCDVQDDLTLIRK